MTTREAGFVYLTLHRIRQAAAMEIVSTLRTTGAVRTFTDEPVDDDVIHEILDDARFAPSGGNRQPWRVAVVKDPTIRRHLGDLMQPVWDGYVAAVSGSRRTTGSTTASHPLTPAPNALLDGIATIPVVLVVAADMRQIALMDTGLERPPLAGGGSIYPFCWSMVLSARARGLGGVITTFLSRAEPAAAPELGLPAHHALAATIFLGVPEHQPTKLRRQPVEAFTTIDRFDGAPFTP